MTGRGRDIAASVRQRLFNLTRERREEFQSVLTRYGIERFLYRLAQSRHGDEFVLKGAMLFTLWTREPHRATWDLDLLGRGTTEIDRLEEVFRDVCGAAVPADGLEFDAASVHGGRIREDQEYEGVRVKLLGHLGKARILIQVDIGFGDAVVPRPRKTSFPTMLDHPPPVLRAYPRESVVAEKFHAMVVLGMGNTRMKDFFDVWSLALGFDFDGAAIRRAFAATFERRRTPLPREAPLALTRVFTDDASKRAQWAAFLRKGHLLASPPDLPGVAGAVHAFVMPPAAALVAAEAFPMEWHAGGPWTEPRGGRAGRTSIPTA